MQAPTITVPVAGIRAGDNDRVEFVDEALKALAASIGAQGLLSVPTVPVAVSEADDALAAEMMLVENEVRANLNPVEQGRAYAKRIALGASVGDVARLIGQSERFVTYRVMLLDLCPRVLELVASGAMATPVALSMVGLDADRQMLALEGLNAGLNGRQFDALVERLHTEQNEQPLFDAATFMQVEEYVVEAKATAKMGAVGRLRSVTERMIEALEAAGLEPELVAEGREALKAETTRKAEKALERWQAKR
jgi:hypothetical protein